MEGFHLDKNSKIIKYSMLDEFDVQGIWWVPVENNEDKEELSGSLYSEDGQFFLSIIGSLSESEIDMKTHNYLHGFTVKGEKVTLIDCIPINKMYNAPGIAQQTVMVTSFLTGDHFNNINQIEFQSVNVSSTYLTQWFNSTPFRSKDEIDEKSKIIGNSTSVIMPKIQKFYIPFLDAEFRNHGYFKSTGDYYESMNYFYKESFMITPTNGNSYEWFKEIIVDLNKLLTLLINEPIYFREVIFNGEYEDFEKTGGEKRRKKYHLYLSQNGIKEKEKMGTYKMLFTYKDVRNHFSNLLNNWFEKKDNLKSVYNSYLSTHYNSSDVLETKFLNTIQTLEIYHRTQGRGKLFSDETRESYLSTLNKIMEDKIPTEVQKEINSKLQYFNEYSLLNRLKDILQHLNPDTILYLFENKRIAKDFFYKIVLTRNDLTHLGISEKEKAYKGIDLYYATNLMKILSAIKLFTELGLEEDNVLNAIKKHFNLSFIISDSKTKLGLTKK